MQEVARPEVLALGGETRDQRSRGVLVDRYCLVMVFGRNSYVDHGTQNFIVARMCNVRRCRVNSTGGCKSGRGILSMAALSHSVVRVDKENSLNSLTLQVSQSN